nr:PREDICTED: diphosphomevalonate decarboxylase [Apteryx mantelli mantelli]
MSEDKTLTMVTCTAPANMAVIKYWGKRDSDLILPINSSLSVTLHQDQLKTTTTAAISRDFKEDRLWLNGEEADVGHPRLQSCLREVRRLARNVSPQHRAEALVPERIARMVQHIRERDFEGFGQLTMRDSNQFHATCLDTFPPIFYLNDVSRRIIALAHRYNAHHGCTKVAYTFDAGPNAMIFALADTVAEFVEVVRCSFPPAPNGDR